MRRVLAFGALTLLVLIPLATGCRGDSAPTPTVASTDFTPKATIEVSDSSPLTVDIASGGTDLGSGSVLLVTNTGHSDHRLVGTIDTTQVFDTGTLEPGNQTTVVLVPDGQLHIADLTTDREVTVQVTPRAGS
ncbi:MAG: hypothetical protein ACXWCM_03800 [Acidimicrobiales bacterium]